MTVHDTLAERARTYGDFQDIAKISGDLQRIMRSTRNWDALPDDMREALQTIASKIARVLNGDPEHIDSWHDIAGYATLVERRLRLADAKVPLVCDPPISDLAIPPEGFETKFEPRQTNDLAPWAARRVGSDTWYWGHTHADALLQAGYSGG